MGKSPDRNNLNRITIMIPAALQKKLREKQAGEIRAQSRQVSFSEIICEYAEKGLKR